MGELPEEIDGLPNICGSEQRIEEAIRARGTDPVFLPPGAAGFDDVNSAFAVALHMHQPLVPAGGPDLRTAPIISNLQWMMDNPGIGDNHNAPVFLWCYKRMGEFVPQLLDEGFAPRVMLEYSGTLLHGLRQMGAHDVLDALAGITTAETQPAGGGVAGLSVGACRGALHPGPGLPAARAGLAAPFRRSFRPGCPRAGSAASPLRRWPCPTTPMSLTSS